MENKLLEIKSKLTVPNVLLTSYVLLVVISGFGVIFAICDFGYGPITEEPKTTIDLSTFNYTYHYTYMYDTDSMNETEESKMYREYVWQTRPYAYHENFPSFYIILPCGVAFIYTGIFLLIELLKKNLLKTTTGLYSSFGILVMVYGFMQAHQKECGWATYDKFKLSYWWVTAIHSIMGILLVLQMILSIWEMRRQKVSWPTIHISQFFTIGIFVREALMILTVITQVGFLANTIKATNEDYETPSVRYPSYYFMPCAVACLYGLVVCFEAYTSQIFGHIHNQMMGASGLMMVFGNMVVTIIALPPISGPVLNGRSDRLVDSVLVFSSTNMCIGLIYSILCLTVPAVLNTPPGMMRFLAYSLSLKKSLKEGCLSFWKNLKESNTLGGNLIVTLLSCVCIVLMAIEWSPHLAIMLCPDVAILYRTLSASIIEISTQVPPSVPPVQILFLVFMENVSLIIGIIWGIVYICGFTYDMRPIGCPIAAVVLNCIIVIFQFYKVQTNPEVRAQIIEMDNGKDDRRTKEEHPEEVPLNGEAEKTDEEEGKKNEETEAASSVYPELSVISGN